MKRYWMISLTVLAVSILFLTQQCSYMRIPRVYDGVRYGRLPVRAPESRIYLPYNLKPLPAVKKLDNSLELAKYSSLEKAFEKNGTLALLVLKNDTIIYENYFNGFDCDTVTQIFSATKPMIISMLSLAIEDGYISSLDQKVADFLPQFAKGDHAGLTLRHLAQMRSGFDYNEYKEIFQTLKFYYRHDLESFVSNPDNLKLKYLPGEKFVYKSIDTQLLSICLEKALNKSLIEYFYEKIWMHIGAEKPAFWSVDELSSSIPKYYGGLNVSVKDLAKLGLMYMHDGRWNDRTIIPSHWANYCDDTANTNGKDRYCMGWWYDLKEPANNIYFGAGFGGQIFFINETTNTVFVRLGTKKGGMNWYRLFKELSLVI